MIFQKSSSTQFLSNRLKVHGKQYIELTSIILGSNANIIAILQYEFLTESYS